jgi:hypothetical protein
LHDSRNNREPDLAGKNRLEQDREASDVITAWGPSLERHLSFELGKLIIICRIKNIRRKPDYVKLGTVLGSNVLNFDNARIFCERLAIGCLIPRAEKELHILRSVDDLVPLLRRSYKRVARSLLSGILRHPPPPFFKAR